MPITIELMTKVMAEANIQAAFITKIQNHARLGMTDEVAATAYLREIAEWNAPATPEIIIYNHHLKKNSFRINKKRSAAQYKREEDRIEAGGDRYYHPNSMEAIAISRGIDPLSLFAGEERPLRKVRVAKAMQAQGAVKLEVMPEAELEGAEAQAEVESAPARPGELPPGVVPERFIISDKGDRADNDGVPDFTPKPDLEVFGEAPKGFLRKR